MKRLLGWLFITLMIVLVLGSYGCSLKDNKGEDSDYLALVQDTKSGLYGYINGSGQYVAAPQFAEGSDIFVNGFALVKDADSKLYGYIDKSGRIVIEPQYKNAGDFAENGLARVQDVESSLWGYIDESGQFVVQPQYSTASDFHIMD